MFFLLSRRTDRVRWRRSVVFVVSNAPSHDQGPTDGMIIIWAPSSSPQAATYGSDLSAEDLQHEKEYWKPRTTFRYVFHEEPFVCRCLHHASCTTMQVYDLAWSPTGEHIIAGSTDNTARVFTSAEGVFVSISFGLTL